MKRTPLALLLIGCMAGTAIADSSESRANVQYSTRPIHAAFVWALGKDVKGSSDAELAIQEELIKHGVAGQRSSKLFPKGMVGSANHILSRLRRTGCDSVLVVRRTSSVHWESENSHTNSLRAFIAHRAQLLTPKDSLQANTTSPIVIANATGNANWEIVEGEVIVFETNSGEIIWRGDTQIKSAKDLPQATYFKFLAEKVAASLEAAGLVGSVKK